MKNEIPDNVIQFPTFERVKQVINEKIDVQIEKADQEEIQKEECVELAHYCFQLMDQAITGNEFIDGFEDMDFLDLSKPECKDMSVIINLLAATFYRYKELKHPFQDNLDIGNQKLDDLMSETEEIKAEVELKELEDEIEKLLNKESEEDDID